MILCIDTCTNVCSVAILNEQKEVLIERIYNDKLKHSEILMIEIEEMLKILEKDAEDIEKIYVANGPGSFTGIRIGVTAANTMADINNVPVIGVSVLDTLAMGVVYSSKIVCSLLDAGNDRYYYGIYEVINNRIKLIEGYDTKHIDELKEIFNSYENEIIIVGKVLEGHKNLLNDVSLADNVFNIPRASFMAYSGNCCIEKYVSPMYIEKPQAQKLLEKNKND